MSEELNLFRNYVTNRGVDFDTLTKNEKREWSSTFDNYNRPQGKNSLIYNLFISIFIIICNYM